MYILYERLYWYIGILYALYIRVLISVCVGTTGLLTLTYVYTINVYNSVHVMIVVLIMPDRSL